MWWDSVSKACLLGASHLHLYIYLGTRSIFWVLCWLCVSCLQFLLSEMCGVWEKHWSHVHTFSLFCSCPYRGFEFLNLCSAMLPGPNTDTRCLPRASNVGLSYSAWTIPGFPECNFKHPLPRQQFQKFLV